MHSLRPTPWLRFHAAALSVAAVLGLAFSSTAAQAQNLPSVPAGSVFQNVPEASQYGVVYELNLPNQAQYNFNPISYAQDNSANVSTGGFTRIAYALELNTTSSTSNNPGTKWVWVSFDRPSNITSASKIGVPNTPTGEFYHYPNGSAGDTTIANMNVYSNVPGVVTGTGITTGNIEFWSYDYSTGNQFGVPGANGSTYDFGDTPAMVANYGSMQIHNYGAAQTVFAINDWGNAQAGGIIDIGIGNQVGGSGHPDWTFAHNASGYVLKHLYVLVQTGTPVITSPGNLTARLGTSFSQAITATGTPTPSFSAIGLPAGLSISATGVISGTPTATGTYNVTVTAANSVGSASTSFTLTVQQLQSLTVYGTNAPAGTIDPNTDCSRDGDVTWLPAYAATIAHPWGNIPGTARWISRVANMASASTTSSSNPETLDFRIRFYAPSDISNAQLTYQMNPDNYGDIYLNGTKLNASQITGGSGVDATATITNANIVAGLNTILVRLTDTGGVLGINYVVAVQGYASAAFQQLTAPPEVTNVTSTLGNGGYRAGTFVPIQVTFTDAVTVTGTPTLTLSDGGTASYASGSGSTTLTFNYTVQPGDNSSHLDFASTSALALNGGTIISSAADAQAANLILPSPGASGSLGANKTFFIDTTAPVLTVPGNQIAEATSAAGATVNFAASATDNLSTPVINYSMSPGSVFPLGTTTVSVFAIDRVGNTSTGSFTVTVRDTTKPTITPPANITAEATSASGAVVSFTATATDAVTASPTITYSKNPGTTFPLGTTPVTITATDAAGNAQTATFSVTVRDTTKPTLTPPANITTEATSASGAVVSFSATASDTVTTSPTITYSKNPGTTFPLGTTPVTVTATDAAGNAQTATFTVTVHDTTAPTLSLPANLTAEATSASGAIVTFSATASDAVSGSVPVTLTPASGSTFPLGTTTVNATATDGAGNSSTGNFTVTVRDTTPPVVTVTSAADFTENFNGYTNYIPYVPQYQSGLANGYLGTVPGWTATGLHAVHAVNLDGNGNWAVMIWEDNVITSTRTTADNANGTDYVVHFSAGPAVSATPSQATTAADGLLIQILRADNSVLQSFSYQPGAWAGAPALVPVSFHYTGDGSGPVHVQVGPLVPNDGHFGGAIDDISITPTTPADITLEATSPAGAVATWGAAAYDLVSGNVPVTGSASSGSTFPIGTTPVTLSATDAAGNTSSATFNVIVKDTTPPALTAPANVSVDATSAAGATVSFAATATDAGTASPTITYSQNPGTVFALGTTTVTVTATDAAGNTSTGSFTVTVNPAVATITLTTPAYTYDGTAKLATATTDFAGVSPTFTYDGNATAPTAAGTYAVVASVNLPWISGTANGTLTITPAALTVTAASEAKVYGSADPSLAFAITSGTLFGSDGFSGSLLRAPGENVGNYAIGQGTLTAGANYALTYVGAGLTITPAPVIVTATPQTKVYGSPDPALAFSSTGLVGTDAFGGSLVRTAGENVGTYAIGQGTLTAGANYALSFNGAQLTITPKPASVTPNAATKVYGAADPTLTGTLSGFLPTDIVAATYSRTAGETVAGSPYTISAALSPAGVLSNYSITSGTAAFTITPATLAIAANPQTKVYGAADPALTYAVNGLQFSDTATSVITGALTRVSGETVKGSPYAIQLGTLAANTNYTVAYTGANLTITPATATVTVNGYTGVYDGKAHGATGSATGVNNGALATLLDLGASFTNVPGGTANWAFHDPAGNYSDQSGHVAITITPAAATIVVTPYSVTYDGKPHTATGTATGVNNEPLAGLVLSGTTHTNAGFYSTDTWTFTDATGNYANAGATITDTIAKAPVTIALAPLAQMYDGTAKPVTATTTETPTATLTVTISYNGGTTAPTLPGSYTVVATVVDPNYSGTLTATETIGVTALVRHGITLSGDVDGSLQILNGEDSTLNGNGGITGDLLVPGLPAVRLNGKPTFGGLRDSTGATTPTGYTVTLNGGSLLRYLVRRVDPLTMPTVAAPALPTGTRQVTVNKSNDPIGDWSTVKDLTLNGNVGNVAVPAGIYGAFTANGSSGFTLGVAGATTPSVYEFQSLTLNGNTALKVVGPVTIILKGDLAVNGNVGASGHPEWLDLRSATGSVTLNGKVTVDGYVTAPNGTITINGNSTLNGGITADKLVINGNGALVEPTTP